MAGTYKDFIPAGEELGALGNGFTDFVPTRQPQPQPVEEVQEQVVADKRLDNLAKARAVKAEKLAKARAVKAEKLAQEKAEEVKG